MSLDEEVAQKATLRRLGDKGRMVRAMLPSQEALLASPDWALAAKTVLDLAEGREVKFLAAGRDKVVLDIGNNLVVRLLPTTKEDGIGLEKAFRRAVAGVGMEELVVPVLAEEQVGSILLQLQPKLRRERVGKREVREVMSELARHDIAWVDAYERNLGRMPDGRLVILDGGFKWRGLGEKIIEAVDRWIGF